MCRAYPVLSALLAVALALSPACRPPALGADAPSPSAFFVDDYFNAYFAPSTTPTAGLHQYDDQLEDGSAEAAKKRVEAVKPLRARLDKLRAGTRNARQKRFDAGNSTG
jgi:hypothetical protein